jgi:hypothetical protein
MRLAAAAIGALAFLAVPAAGAGGARGSCSLQARLLDAGFSRADAARLGTSLRPAVEDAIERASLRVDETSLTNAVDRGARRVFATAFGPADRARFENSVRVSAELAAPELDPAAIGRIVTAGDTAAEYVFAAGLDGAALEKLDGAMTPPASPHALDATAGAAARSAVATRFGSAPRDTLEAAVDAAAGTRNAALDAAVEGAVAKGIAAAFGPQDRARLSAAVNAAAGRELMNAIDRGRLESAVNRAATAALGRKPVDTTAVDKGVERALVAELTGGC